ncbi:MAG: PIN domain-containing protein [Methylotenera sp.]
MQVLISDANILIDLEEGLLIDKIFELPFVFKIPDVLFHEELSEQHNHLIALGLQLGELTGESLIKVFALIEQYPQPSRNDCLALALAKQENCPLITGDRNLRKAAETEQVQVYGTLWIIEHLVQHDIINKPQAHSAYDRMEQYGRRLPWAEAHLRINNL